MVNKLFENCAGVASVWRHANAQSNLARQNRACVGGIRSIFCLLHVRARVELPRNNYKSEYVGNTINLICFDAHIVLSVKNSIDINTLIIFAHCMMANSAQHWR